MKFIVGPVSKEISVPNNPIPGQLIISKLFISTFAAFGLAKEITDKL